jgi:hypothetical protein
LKLGKRAPIGGDKWRFYFNRGEMAEVTPEVASAQPRKALE